jgi:excisionase family DNA binding protein
MASSTRLIAHPAVVERLAEVLAEKVVARLPQWGDEDPWMTSAEAAAYLALPISTLRKLTAAGSIPFSQDVAGGRCYFKRSELDRWRHEGASSSPNTWVNS